MSKPDTYTVIPAEPGWYRVKFTWHHQASLKPPKDHTGADTVRELIPVIAWGIRTNFGKSDEDLHARGLPDAYEAFPIVPGDDLYYLDYAIWNPTLKICVVVTDYAGRSDFEALDEAADYWARETVRASLERRPSLAEDEDEAA